MTTAVMVLVLLGLGTWQVYRLQWKLGLLAQIAAGEQAPPVPLGANPRPFTKVSVVGRFRFEKTAAYGVEVRDTPAGPLMGAQQIVPLERQGAPPILVDRGWVPQPAPPSVSAPRGEVTVTGYIRPSEPAHWFSPAPDLEEPHFYALDAAPIATALGLPAPEPYVLVALGTPEPDVYPQPAQHLPRPPNNHLSYAITWYGLAVAGIVIFIVWARKRPAA